MKTVVLIRHADSSWAVPFGKDMERELTTKGVEDATAMAAFLFEQGMSPDRIYSSPATRALQTARIFSEGVNPKEPQIHIESSLYEPSVRSFYNVIESVPDDIRSVFIFSHNPGISEFIVDLDLLPFLEMPPCGVFAFELVTAKWDELRTASRRFLFFRYP